MIEKIKKIIEKRHFWRTVGFDELSELYISQMLRSLSSSLVGLFVPIYLYKLGHSVMAICGMFVVWFLVRPLWSYVSARIIGRFGPKHAIALSVMAQIIYLSFVLTIQTVGWPLWIVGIIGSFCYSLYMMAFEVDFSKIKHSTHGGKELSYMQMFERIGAILGPVIGGLVATFIDPRFTIGLAIVTLCGSLVPIFMSAETVRQNQLIIVKGFPWKRHRRDMYVGAAFALENVVSVTVWPLFLGIFVLRENTYATLGILAAVSTVTTFVAVFAIGKMIDNNKGLRLLSIGVVLNGILHFVRPLATLPVHALAINVADEPLTAMYRMPFLKGRYDAADSVPGYRIVYFMLLELFIAAANILFWGLLTVIAMMISDRAVFQAAFIIGGIMSFLITQQRFAALKVTRS